MNQKALITFVLLSIGQLALPQSFNDEPLKAELGITLGSWFEGQINVGAADVTKESSFVLCALLDYYVAPKLALGFYATLSPNIQIAELRGENAKGSEFGVSIKPRIPIGEKIAIKPGLLIGYRKIKPDDNDVDPILGLGINASLELQYQFGEKLILFIQPGFYSQPVGGNDDFEVDFPPIGYFSVGLSVPFF